MASVNTDTVQVIIRVRPLNSKELNENRKSIVGLDTTIGQISLENAVKGDQLSKDFTFDAVYGEESPQKLLYDESCFPLVESVLEGFNGTIFAYGQTGCGKTHTMQGFNTPPELRGVIPTSFDHIFEFIRASQGTEFLVRCSYLEIYNEEIRDLLSNDMDKKYELKEDPNRGVFVKDLSEVIVEDVETCNQIMNKGQDNRTTGATLMNLTSSRSHAIFTITIEMSERHEDGKDHIKMGKLNLVDLAGSERASKTGAQGERLKEGCKINLSLSALGNVISALVDGKGKHIPYRDSKLTRMLQDSLGGNTKTLMIAAVSPADYNYDESLSTLRYANRAKNIKNKPKINEDPKDAMLRQYKEEIERLKQMLDTKSSVMSAEPSLLAPSSLISVMSETLPRALLSEEETIQSSRRREENESLKNKYSTMLNERDELGKALEEERRNREMLLCTLAELEKKIVNSGHAVETETVMHYPVVIQELTPVKSHTLDEHQFLSIGKLDAPADEYGESRNDWSLSYSKDDEVKLLHLQKKMKASQRQQQRLEAENDRASNEKKEIEEELKTAVESVDELQKKLVKSRKRSDRKLLQAKAEIQDLQEEFEIERESLMDIIRDLERDESFWKSVVMTVTTTPQLDKINSMSKFDDDAGKWHLPKLRFGNSGIEVIELPPVANPLCLPAVHGHRIIHKLDLMKEKITSVSATTPSIISASDLGFVAPVLSNTLPVMVMSNQEPSICQLQPIKSRNASAKTKLLSDNQPNPIGSCILPLGDNSLPMLTVPRTARSTNDVTSIGGQNLPLQVNSHPVSASARNKKMKKTEDSLPVVNKMKPTTNGVHDYDKTGDWLMDRPILPMVDRYG